jgi:hypothetical protein
MSRKSSFAGHSRVMMETAGIEPAIKAPRG